MALSTPLAVLSVPHHFAPVGHFAIRPRQWPSLYATFPLPPGSPACPLSPGSLLPSGLAPSLFLFHATPAWCALDNELFNCCNAKKNRRTSSGDSPSPPQWLVAAVAPLHLRSPIARPPPCHVIFLSTKPAPVCILVPATPCNVAESGESFFFQPKFKKLTPLLELTWSPCVILAAAAASSISFAATTADRR